MNMKMSTAWNWLLYKNSIFGSKRGELFISSPQNNIIPIPKRYKYNRGYSIGGWGFNIGIGRHKLTISIFLE